MPIMPTPWKKDEDIENLRSRKFKIDPIEKFKRDAAGIKIIEYGNRVIYRPVPDVGGDCRDHLHATQGIDIGGEERIYVYGLEVVRPNQTLWMRLVDVTVRPTNGSIPYLNGPKHHGLIDANEKLKEIEMYILPEYVNSGFSGTWKDLGRHPNVRLLPP